MAIYTEENQKKRSILAIANQMMIAARTAPKGKGQNSLEMMVVDGDDIKDISTKLHELAEISEIDFFRRDGHNILNSEAIFLIGTRIQTLGLNEICQLCGFPNCSEKEKHPNTPCVFNTSDLNLALGSAVAIAADNRLDNRIMFSVGKAAQELQYFSPDVKIIFGVPLSALSKNPFFDR